MPAIVVLMLAAVFAAGGLLADAPNAPVREQAETQAIVVPNAEKIRPPEVATRRPDLHWRRQDLLRREWQGRERLRLEERLGEWKRERALACLRGVLPDADESELESALEDTANCIKCPQVCGHLRNEHFLRRDGFRFREKWLCLVPNSPMCRNFQKENFLRRDSRGEWLFPNFLLTLTPNGGTNP